MQKRRIGNLKVSALGYGPMGVSSAYGPAADKQHAIATIPGTTKLHRLEENLGAVDVELTPDDLREIDEPASKIPVQGEPLPEAVLKLTDF